MSNKFPLSSVLELLQADARSNPEGLAIMAPERTSFTYTQLLDQVSSIGSILRQNGLGRHDRIAIVTANGPEMATAVIAVACHAVCVPLNPAFTLTEWYQLFDDLGVDALISDADVGERAIIAANTLNLPIFALRFKQSTPAGCFTLHARTPMRDAIPKGPSPTLDDDAFVLPTSGTTSRPKIVPLTHGNICSSAMSTGRSLSLTSDDRLLNMLPFYHAHGLISGLMASLAAGAAVICTQRFSAKNFFVWLNTLKPSWYTAVPTIHQAVLAAAKENKNTARDSSLRLIRSASASLPDTVLNGLEDQFGVPVIETYGMTEAASQIASNPLPPLPRKAGSVGPAAGPEIAIGDGAGKQLGSDNIGEIMLRGPNMTRGYQGDTATQQTAFIDGWLRTGDQGYLDQDGYLFITGRLKEMINRGGQNISPHEIENTLLAHPGVEQAAAFALPHPTLGEEVGVAIVLAPKTNVDIGSLRDFAAADLAAYKLPRRIVAVDDIPKGPTGKLQRVGLAKRLGLLDTASPMVETGPSKPSPSNAIEHDLTQIWRDVLGIEQVGREDDFFLLGGDSLSATQVLSRTTARFQADVPLPTFFEHPTIAALAESILSTTKDDRQSLPESAGDETIAPLSFQQDRLYFLDQLTSGGNSHHVVELVRLNGRIDVAAIEQALTAIIDRHDILRTVIREDAGERKQVVLEEMPLPFSVKAVPKGLSGKALGVYLVEETRLALCKPFDLQTGPLFQVQLLELGEDKHGLLSIFHHLITDGWSQGLFWGELQHHYNAHIDRTSPPLPVPALTYRSFARTQHEWIKTPIADVQRHYWKCQLTGVSMLQLPTDKPRPQTLSGKGARHSLTLSGNLVRQLKTLGRQQRCTLFMTLLAGFQTLLHRYTQHLDIAVGSLIANRNSLALENLFGMLANTVLLRTNFADDPSFEVILQQVRSTTLEAYRHQDLPFEEVLSGRPAYRHANQNASFPVLCLLQTPPPQPPKLRNVSSAFMPIDPGTARFDLTLELIDQGQELSGWFEYSTDLFEPPTIQRMADHFLRLLEVATADPTMPVSMLSLLSETECRDIEHDARGPNAEPPSDLSIPVLFERQVTLFPESTAIIMGDVQLSFATLNKRANQLAHHLVTMGVGRDDFVGLMVERGPEMVIAVFGILKAQAAFVPLDPDYPADRLAFILEDSGVNIVVSQNAFAVHLTGPHLRPIFLDKDQGIIGQQPSSNPAWDLPAANLAYVLYTSGSTGRPKGVLGRQRGLLHILNWVWRHLPFEVDEVCCHKTSISFGDALQELFAPLLQGRPIVMIDKATLIDPEHLVNLLARHQIRRLVLVPSLLRMLLLEVPKLGERLPDLRLWISSGEALGSDLLEQFQGRLPDRRLINIYGASEMADIVTWHEVSDTDDLQTNSPIGRPIDNVAIYVLDDNQQLLPRGVPGELCVSSPGLALGYHQRPKLERQVFVPNPFGSDRDDRLYRTGDRVRLGNDGRLAYLGRLDQQVQIRGCRVELGEVEHALLEHPEIEQAIVVAKPDQSGNLGLVAFVQPSHRHGVNGEDLHHFTRGKLPNYMVPSAFPILPELPLTPSGKIDRQVLLANVDNMPTTSSLPNLPRSPTEELLMGIWSEALKVDTLGTKDSFFEQGGHSLLAGQILARVREASGVSLPLRSLFERPTIGEFAPLIDAALTDQQAAEGPPIEPLASDAPKRPSRAQAHVFRVESSLPGLPIFNLPYAFRLKGYLDLGVFEEAIHQVIQRHEGLRTRFRLIDDEVVLVVEDTVAATIDVEDVADDAAATLLAKEEAWTPFNVADDPLLRVRLLKLGPDDHVCLMTIHHIIADGWSVGILVREISERYNAGITRGPACPSLLPAPTFSAIAAWQHRWCQSDAGDRQRAFWTSLLHPKIKARQDKDNTAKAALSLNIKHLPVHLPGKLAARLNRFARSHGSTLYMTLLAGFVAALAPKLARPDLIIGTIMANRMRATAEHVFGPLENIVLLPLDAGTERSVIATMHDVRKTVLDASAHQDLPFDELAETWQQDGKAALPTLIDAMFVFQDAMRSSLDLHGVETEAFGDVYRTGQPVLPITSAPLTMILRETPAGIIGSCVFKANKIDQQQVPQLLATYIDLLGQV